MDMEYARFMMACPTEPRPVRRTFRPATQRVQPTQEGGLHPAEECTNCLLTKLLTCFIFIAEIENGLLAVSYTHLDVYKRQAVS